MNSPPCSVRRACCVCGIGALVVCALLWAGVRPAQAVVHLAYFQATGREIDVLIEWGTGSELTTWGFNLYRGETENRSTASKLNQDVIKAGLQAWGQEYSYVDSVVEAGTTYYYWLEVLDYGGNEFFGPESARPGPPPTSAPTPTPTGTRVPTATSVATLTKTPTPTSTSMPTVTPSFTATGVPTFTPAGSPTTTPVLLQTSSPSSTSVVEQRLSPTVTPGGVAQPTLTAGPAQGERTPMPTATTVAGTSATSTATPVVWGGYSEPETPGWSSLRLRFPTIQSSTILLLISVMSLLGAVLLTVALALVRRLSL